VTFYTTALTANADSDEQPPMPLAGSPPISRRSPTSWPLRLSGLGQGEALPVTRCVLKDCPVAKVRGADGRQQWSECRVPGAVPMHLTLIYGLNCHAH
jgi:hypothetical protein